MIRKNFSYKQGFTLIELLLALAITSLVIMLSASLLNFGIKTYKLTTEEYDIQSAVRRVTEETTQIVRYSKAVFAVPETFVSNTSKLDSGWNYFMVSADGKSIVSLEYSGTKHEERVLVSEHDNIKYEVFFEKDTSANSENVMKYKIYAYETDDAGNKTTKKIVFESTVEATNAVQVVDKGTGASPSIALAYRNDGQISAKSVNQMAYVTIVVDVSGSMNDTPSGKTSNKRKPSRISYVRDALTGTDDNPEIGIIQQFSEEENVFISLVPFSTTANYPNPIANTNTSDRHPIYDVYNETNKNNLVEMVKKLKAEGGTNTGDGLRQAYHLHDDFRTRMSIPSEDQVHHYMILLVDGETTYETKNGIWNRYWHRRRGYYWEFDASTSNPKYYLENGNINDFFSDYVYGSNLDIKYAISGTGYTVIKNSQYVINIGNLIKNFEGGNGIKSYMIGYAKNLGSHINSVGTSIGTEGNNIYRYDDPGFDLEDVFENIANDIMTDYWLVAGPQIKNR